MIRPAKAVISDASLQFLADRAIAEDEFDLRVFIEPHCHWQAVVAPRVDDHIEPRVWKDRLPILQNEPLKSRRLNLLVVLRIEIGVLREVGEHAAVLRMELKTRQHYLLASAWKGVGELQVEVLKLSTRLLAHEPANVEVFGIEWDAADHATIVG